MRTRRLHRMSIDDGGSGVGARALLPIERDGTLDAALHSALESGAAKRDDPRAIRKSGVMRYAPERASQLTVARKERRTRMRKIALVFVLAVAAVPIAAKYKVKQKSFEPVVIHDVRSIAGRYVGIANDFEVELMVDANGKVAGTLVQRGKTTALRDIVID